MFTVAIVGRPNVGKSTFFNRLLEQRKAIVDDVSGVTRDRQYGVAEWIGKSFNLIDTGGFVPDSEDVFEREIARQVQIAVEEANALIFVVDVTSGITNLDKVDNYSRQLDANEFYSLGFENTFFISCLSGTGVGEVLDGVVGLISDSESEDTLEKESLPKFSIMGQPNVGKSSLLNALIGQERTIVSDIAGTTRDTIHTHYNLFNKEFMLIDTAGIRKKTKVHEDLEFYSVIRAIKAMDEADVCIILLDAQKGIAAQDLNIYSLAAKKGKGIVLAINKWDTVEKQTNTARDYEKQLREKLAPFNDIPILFISAKEKLRILKVIEMALEVYEKRTRKIPTSQLNDKMQKAIEAYKPPMTRGHIIRIKYVTQLPTSIPSFAFFSNYPEEIKLPYKNYLENKLRENFDFKGVPIRIFFRKS
jgi:GTPase